MKKMFAILILFMYSLSVSGSVVQMHFCGQEIESISFLESNKSCCCAAAKDKSADQHISKQDKDCCDNVAISLKISADQHVEAAKQLQLLQTVAAVPPLLHYAVYEAPYVAGVEQASYDANAPPPGLWQDIPLYKLFQRIVYYG
jgi:hypothetical protein